MQGEKDEQVLLVLAARFVAYSLDYLSVGWVDFLLFPAVVLQIHSLK